MVPAQSGRGDYWGVGVDRLWHDQRGSEHEEYVDLNRYQTPSNWHRQTWSNKESDIAAIFTSVTVAILPIGGIATQISGSYTGNDSNLNVQKYNPQGVAHADILPIYLKPPSSQALSRLL